MGREKEGFREQLARLDEQYPGKETLSIKEACAACGADRKTLLSSRGFPAKKLGDTRSCTGGVYIVPKVELARWLVSD